MIMGVRLTAAVEDYSVLRSSSCISSIRKLMLRNYGRMHLLTGPKLNARDYSTQPALVLSISDSAFGLHGVHIS
jgi:hypothetical protein